MEQGTVKWFDDSKGFGFITNSDGSEAFVHHTSIQGNGKALLRVTMSALTPKKARKAPRRSMLSNCS